MNDCIFCKIANKEIPSLIVYEDTKTMAFLDISPINKGHVLVIPKKHFVNLLDVDKEYLNAVMQTSQKVTKAVKEAVNADGLNVSINNFKEAGQAVFHLHVHIIPRFKNDGLKTWERSKEKNWDDNEVVKEIKSKL
ncbi:HIT family protein [Candidatus Woesearchaeota archaeon]|nr:HIT family protein [Candidatus Woesearchaeota archaeon]